MSYPGLTFALMVGVAIGTAIYYYFKSENANTAYQYCSPSSPPPVPGYDTRTSRCKRRRNSNTSQNCSICFEPLRPSNTQRISCGHIFHSDCIAKWFRASASTTCPNCRAQM